MDLIRVPCDVPFNNTHQVSIWLYQNVGRMAADIPLIDDESPWFVLHYVVSPSIYLFKHEQDAVLFTLRWS